MSQNANVRSLDAVRQLRPVLIRFEEDAAGGLEALRQELNRTLAWLDHDRPAYFRQELKRSFDQIAEARTQLMRRKMMTVGGRKPDCIEEEKALKKAKRRQEEIQQKIRLVKQWSIKAHRAADEFTTRIGQFDWALSHDLPKIVGLIDRIITTLESYASSSVSASSTETNTKDEDKKDEGQSTKD